MTPQQNGALSLTGNKRPPPQQKGDAKQGSILDYYNWPGWPALTKIQRIRTFDPVALNIIHGKITPF